MYLRQDIITENDERELLQKIHTYSYTVLLINKEKFHLTGSLIKIPATWLKEINNTARPVCT